jgi:beta-1,4-mannosyl-glycoprotein beta-1,4-N-acetylglucosaminyltransferase
MIIDSFPFFNEYELCNIRLNYLNNAVDAFVITESNLTWRCQPNNKKFDKVYKGLSDNIKKKIHYEFLEYSDNYISSQDHTNKKTIQNLSRDKLGLIAQEICKDDDIFFYSDLDEFWDKRELPTIINLVKQHNYVVCNQDFRVIYVNWFARLREWPGTRITTIEQLDKKHPLSEGIFHHTKSKAFHRMYPFRSGWHFSYFGSAEQRTQKLKGIRDAQDWEKRKGKSYAEIANSINSMQEWNLVARKKKINARYNLPGIELDPELQSLFKKYPNFFEA